MKRALTLPASASRTVHPIGVRARMLAFPFDACAADGATADTVRSRTTRKDASATRMRQSSGRTSTTPAPLETS